MMIYNRTKKKIPVIYFNLSIHKMYMQYSNYLLVTFDNLGVINPSKALIKNQRLLLLKIYVLFVDSLYIYLLFKKTIELVYFLFLFLVH